MKLVILDQKLAHALRQWSIRERIAVKLTLHVPRHPPQLVIEVGTLETAAQLLQHLEKLCGRQSIVLEDGMLYIGQDIKAQPVASKRTEG